MNQASDPAMSVSVVIPSLLRPSLAASISSVLAQHYEGRVEIIVVADREEHECSTAEVELARGADHLAFTGGGMRGGHARNVGIQASTGDLVTFLDDDDLWAPDKLALQVATYCSPGLEGTERVVSCRTRERADSADSLSRPVPSRLIQPTERVEDYLFRARRPSMDRSTLMTSTLMTSRALATRVPWRSDLRRHQDWDWLLRLQDRGAAHIVHTPDALVTIAVGTTGSVSASPDWSASLEWAATWSSSWSKQTYVDFVVAQPLRYALHGRSFRGVFSCFCAVARSFRIPHPGPMMIGLGGALGRRTFERLMIFSGRAVSR
jgi:glycosyltransferase involved in cell wall biosynthesis